MAEQAGGRPLREKSEIELTHDNSKARFDKLKEAEGQLKALRSGLDGLVVMGDTIEPDDVVKVAANLTSAGFDPHELAVLLSSMPPAGGEMLQQWVLAHEQQVNQWEQQIGPMLAQARHQLGVDALHVLMEDHLGGPQTPRAGAAPTSGPAGGPAMGMAPQAGAPMQAGAPSAGPSMGLSASSPVMGSA